MAEVIGEALHVTHELGIPNLQVKYIPYMSVCHLSSCLSSSIDANKQGWHSTALCLMRQCVETLTITDLGLQDPNYSQHLLEDWAEGKKSHGELRKRLEQDIWPSYGRGLWDESWMEFFGNLARSVQPYAHYSRELQEWQWAVVRQNSDTSFIATMGPYTYDALRASRITLLHILAIWALARILLETKSSNSITQKRNSVSELRKALADSKLLFKGKDWATQLMPHVYFKHGHSYIDA